MPKTIKVLSFVFTVHTDAASVRKLRVDDQSRDLGMTELGPLKITVDANYPPSQVRDTLLHEILHAVCWASGGWRKETEEDYIARTSSILLTVFRDNPDVVAFLTAE